MHALWRAFVEVVERGGPHRMAWPHGIVDAGADVRFPEDTEWGQHEGVLIDPDGNMIRFGSPI